MVFLNNIWYVRALRALLVEESINQNKYFFFQHTNKASYKSIFLQLWKLFDENKQIRKIANFTNKSLFLNKHLDNNPLSKQVRLYIFFVLYLSTNFCLYKLHIFWKKKHPYLHNIYFWFHTFVHICWLW